MDMAGRMNCGKRDAEAVCSEVDVDVPLQYANQVLMSTPCLIISEFDYLLLSMFMSRATNRYLNLA